METSTALIVTSQEGTYCPHCQSQNIYANGKLKAIQRYVCKDCKKNFSERTGTALAWIKKQHLWPIYVRNMFEGYSLEKCAKLTGVSKQTSFDWRHKILSSLRSLSPKEFSGISEIDDIFSSTIQKKVPGTLRGRPGKEVMITYSKEFLMIK